MRIVCDNCSTKYSISDDKVKGKVFKIRCKNCSHVIIVRGDEQAAAAAAGGGAAAATGGGGDAVWYIVRNGQQDGPYSPKDIEGFVASGEVTGDTYTWREGFGDWMPLTGVAELSHVVSAAAPAPAPSAHLAESTARVSNEPNSFAEDEATRVVGMNFGEPQAPANPDPQPAYNNGPQHDPDLAPTAAIDMNDPGMMAAAAAAAPIGGMGISAFSGGAAAMDVGGGAAAASGGAGMGDSVVGSFDAPSLSGLSSFGGSLDGGASEPLPQAPKATASASGLRESVDGPNMVGARNEDSVLFSLNSLQTSAASQKEEKTNTEASGLIDIQALASTNAAVSEGRAKGPAGPAIDPFGGNTAGPAIAPAPIMPMGTRKSNLPLILGIAGGLTVIALLIGVIGFLVFYNSNQKTVVVKGEDEAVASTEKSAGDGAEKAAVAAKDTKADEKAEEDEKGDEKAEEEGDEKAEADEKAEEEGDEKAEAEAVADNKKVDKKPARELTPQERAEREKALAEKAAQREKDREERDKARREAEKNKKDDKKPARKGGGGDNIDDILDNIGGKQPAKKADPVVKKEDKTPPPTEAKKGLDKKQVQRTIRGAYGRVRRLQRQQRVGRGHRPLHHPAFGRCRRRSGHRAFCQAHLLAAASSASSAACASPPSPAAPPRSPSPSGSASHGDPSGHSCSQHTPLSRRRSQAPSQLLFCASRVRSPKTPSRCPTRSSRAHPRPTR